MVSSNIRIVIYAVQKFGPCSKNGDKDENKKKAEEDKKQKEAKKLEAKKAAEANAAKRRNEQKKAALLDEPPPPYQPPPNKQFQSFDGPHKPYNPEHNHSNFVRPPGPTHSGYRGNRPPSYRGAPANRGHRGGHTYRATVPVNQSNENYRGRGDGRGRGRGNDRGRGNQRGKKSNSQMTVQVNLNVDQ